MKNDNSKIKVTLFLTPEEITKLKIMLGIGMRNAVLSIERDKKVLADYVIRKCEEGMKGKEEK